MEPTYPPVPFEKIAELQAIVESRFVVKEMYIDRGIPVFLVSPQPTEEERPEALKRAFKEVALEIKGRGFFPFLRRENGQLVLRIIRKPASTPSRPWIKIALFLATCVTISLSGYLSVDPIWTKELMREVPVVFQVIFFTISLLAIIGLHEFGHKIACMINRIDASMPYFIPAPPYPLSPGGTFGAVITLKEPPTNRDELFDLGLNGPLIGFLVTVVVTFLGVRLSEIVSMTQIEIWLRRYPEVSFGPFPVPLLTEIAIALLGKNPSNPKDFTLLLHPIAFAAWVGAVVTFLNLMPIAVLDGGHISMALFGLKGHRITSIIGLVLLLVTGFWTMALLILFLTFGKPYGVPLLDEVSPLARSRKLAALFVPVMISLCVVFLPYF